MPIGLYTHTPNGSVSHESTCGLTKREYFAGQAMQALLTADVEGGSTLTGVATYAVSQADALIAALSAAAKPATPEKEGSG
jgi:hypothetical protein